MTDIESNNNRDILETVYEFMLDEIKRFGGVVTQDFMVRKNVAKDSIKEGGAFFGIIEPTMQPSGPYRDLSLVIFPSEIESSSSENKYSWVIALGIGSQGFENDYELAAKPGLRRKFIRLLDNQGFCKNTLTDTEGGIPKEFMEKEGLLKVKNSLKKYNKNLPVCQIFSPFDENYKVIISSFLATYVSVRNWASNKNQRVAIDEAIKKRTDQFTTANLSPHNINDEIESILEKRKYVVLQGAPGTGKSHRAVDIAKKITGGDPSKIFFEQFHAETSYSDFVYGLRPNIKSGNLSYVAQEGALIKAWREALKDKSKNVVLIIDEINRANLASVLGPCLYLFENNRQGESMPVFIHEDFFEVFPENLLVVATMNTSDRSLAIVDFALRRRFAWYTLYPEIIPDKALKDDVKFFKNAFMEMCEIFEWHADDKDLALQPGQGYFIARDENEFKDRVVYELMPLIKEYYAEGILLSSKNDFEMFFQKYAKKSLYI